MRSLLSRMDAYQLYQKYSESTHWLPSPTDYDTKNEKLHGLVLQMMKERPETVMECSVDQLTKKMTNLATEEDTVGQVPHQRLQVEPDKGGNFYTCAQARTLCDTSIVGKSKGRIKCIANTLQVNVPIQWVRMFASKVIGTDQPQFYKTQRETDSHIHVISGSILNFLSWVDKAEQSYEPSSGVPKNIITFAWDEGPDPAIHIQNLNKKIRERFQGVSVSVAIMFLASIGLPLHELFKPNDYIQTFQKGRFKCLNKDNIVKSTLRKFIKIKKISPDIESTQLLQQYSTNKGLFNTIMPVSSVQQYLFKHWYSYPTPDELQNILVTAQQLLMLWRTGRKKNMY